MLSRGADTAGVLVTVVWACAGDSCVGLQEQTQEQQECIDTKALAINNQRHENTKLSQQVAASHACARSPRP